MTPDRESGPVFLASLESFLVGRGSPPRSQTEIRNQQIYNQQIYNQLMKNQ